MNPARRRSLVLIGCLLVYLLVMSFGGCADKLILHPSTNAIDARGAIRIEIHRASGGIVAAWESRSPGAQTLEPQAFVLEFTGTGTRAEQVAVYAAARWGEHAIECWTVNYPGYGQSTGPARLASIPPMALESFDAISKVAAGRPVVVSGNSLGTTAALYVAANRAVAGLVLQNPPPLKQVLRGHFGWWNLWLVAGPIALEIPSGLDSIANAGRCQEPAVFFTSQHDGYIPPAYHLEVIDAYRGPKRIVPLDSGHDGAADQSADFHVAMDWLWAQSALSH